MSDQGGVALGQTHDGGLSDLFIVNRDGTVSPVLGGLDRPTSLEFIKNTAYVITLDGTVVRITNVDSSRHHAR